MFKKGLLPVYNISQRRMFCPKARIVATEAQKEFGTSEVEPGRNIRNSLVLIEAGGGERTKLVVANALLHFGWK